MFDPDSFIEEKIREIRSSVKGKAIAAVSGGVDSTTAAALVHKAIGNRLRTIFIDTGFMREGEPKWVKEKLKDVLPLEIIDSKEEFYRRLLGMSDAEEKRRTFREIFYNVLSREAQRWGAEYLVQGTTAPDWIETSGGIKTQHNVLEQVGIDTRRKWGFKVIEPLADLYKDEVRMVARKLGLPREIVERQPFPGPGLLVRVVGKVTLKKLQIVRKATNIVERRLEPLRPSQFFAAVWEDRRVEDEELSKSIGMKVSLFDVKATGVKGDVRAYGPIALLEGEYERALEMWKEVIQSRKDVTHVVWKIAEGKGEYVISIRAVKTENFMTADILEVEPQLLKDIAEEILSKIENVSLVVYDVTPKPPATIEYE